MVTITLDIKSWNYDSVFALKNMYIGIYTYINCVSTYISLGGNVYFPHLFCVEWKENNVFEMKAE